jgi:hypothetical protein
MIHVEWPMPGSVVGIAMVALGLCALVIVGLVAFRAHRSLRQLADAEDRAFDALLGNVTQTTRAITSTTSLVQQHFGAIPQADGERRSVPRPGT